MRSQSPTWRLVTPSRSATLLPCSSFVDPQEDREPLEDAAVAGLPPPLLDLLALLGTQRDGLHRSPPNHWTRPQHSPYLSSTRIIVGNSGTSRLYFRGCRPRT